MAQTLTSRFAFASAFLSYCAHAGVMPNIIQVQIMRHHESTCRRVGINARQGAKGLCKVRLHPVFLHVLLIYRISSPTTLLALPHDVVERIFLYLDAEDVRKCTLVSMQLNSFIRSSVILRYRLACYVAGVVDNSYCTLSFAERYDALMKREKSWYRFQPAFMKTFDDAHEPFPICDLTSGVYLYGDSEGHNLHYCFLPSTPDDVLRWITIPSHAPIKNWNRDCVHIHKVGMAVDEHDLMINVISCVRQNLFYE